MQSLILSLFTILYCQMVVGQNLSGPHLALPPQAHHTSELFVNADRPLFTSARKNSYDNIGASSYMETADNNCSKYHKMKIAGIALAASGGGLILTGAALFISSVGVAFGELSTNKNSNSNVSEGLFYGGLTVCGVGVAAAAAGVPLAVFGSVKYRKECRQRVDNIRTYTQLSALGNGLALNF
jgi:hypothetical protein